MISSIDMAEKLNFTEKSTKKSKALRFEVTGPGQPDSSSVSENYKKPHRKTQKLQFSSLSSSYNNDNDTNDHNDHSSSYDAKQDLEISVNKAVAENHKKTKNAKALNFKNQLLEEFVINSVGEKISKSLFRPEQPVIDALTLRCIQKDPDIHLDKDIMSIFGLMTTLSIDSHMSYLNFGGTLQHLVDSTNSSLLNWGHANLRSPLSSYMQKATNACNNFCQTVSSSKNQKTSWKFWKNNDDTKSDQDHSIYINSLIDVEAHIEIFNDELKKSKPIQQTAYSDLEILLTETKQLIKQIKLHIVVMALSIDDLNQQITNTSVQNPINKHKYDEAISILQSKKNSFGLILSSLDLQILQISQMATQHSQRLLQYEHVASVTFPLWRTNALAYLTQRNETDRQKAWSELTKAQMDFNIN